MGLVGGHPIKPTTPSRSRNTPTRTNAPPSLHPRPHPAPQNARTPGPPAPSLSPPRGLPPALLRPAASRRPPASSLRLTPLPPRRRARRAPGSLTASSRSITASPPPPSPPDPLPRQRAQLPGPLPRQRAQLPGAPAGTRRAETEAAASGSGRLGMRGRLRPLREGSSATPAAPSQTSCLSPVQEEKQRLRRSSQVMRPAGGRGAISLSSVCSKEPAHPAPRAILRGWLQSFLLFRMRKLTPDKRKQPKHHH
ncbi:formin-like protein 5 isoform X2 [Mustela erminea]|uniref:formin-like protein 5 isoform X2 n=1 Tax=Mustela erminea TaxID=36723 RepID=UPI0013875EF5|nr:formin-like protein 5 isoform X2 [Mustela erminea]